MGVSTDVFAVEMAFAFSAINFRQYAMLLLLPPVHMFFKWVHKKDPVLAKAYKNYMREPDLYDPWVRRPVIERRAVGYGRGLHC